MAQEPPSAKKIIDALGRAAMAARLKIHRKTVSDAYAADRMPASWFDVVEAMCVEEGITCPRSAFYFKPGAADADAA